jgi:hypothetical protein
VPEREQWFAGDDVRVRDYGDPAGGRFPGTHLSPTAGPAA